MVVLITLARLLYAPLDQLDYDEQGMLIIGLYIVAMILCAWVAWSNERQGRAPRRRK
jgi:hypothetical protein